MISVIVFKVGRLTCQIKRKMLSIIFDCCISITLYTYYFLYLSLVIQNPHYTCIVVTDIIPFFSKHDFDCGAPYNLADASNIFLALLKG